MKILIGNPSYLFSVIGEQSRLQVLALLLQKPSFVEDIRKKLKVEETLLSKHLKALRDSGLVQVTRHGRRILYEINPSVRKGNSKDYLCLDCCEIKLKNI
ncbi:MAG: winged helix-turn-helix transcriptional regulator [Bdellovibrionales bacterium]|nr:winged helix-turn-helix transcriptional regulator [Bdellovibrionales bacterium]